MFELRNLNFKYDAPIFRDASCEIRSRRVGVVGGNGVGKTTLLHLMNGDLIPESGAIVLPGDVYFVDFSAKNYSYFTPRELISLCRALDRFDDRFDTLTALLGMEGMLDTCLGKLSLGSLKKVFLMLGLASKSEVLLLDEPFENLDEKTNRSLAGYLASCDKHLVIVSHNAPLLQACVEEIYEVTEGTLVKR